MVQLIQRYPLVTFFILAFAITWVVWVPRAVGVPVGLVGQVWTWAPAIAALLAAAFTGERAAIRDLGARLVRWRVGWRWYLVGILGPAVFSLVVAGLYALLSGSSAAVPPVLRGEVPLLLAPLLVPLFLMILTLTDGLGEELAWRGFALPRLLTRHNALVASLILGILWALWHLPLIWTAGSSMYSSLSGCSSWIYRPSRSCSPGFSYTRVEACSLPCCYTARQTSLSYLQTSASRET
jgi:uncharacterized protein